jgi:aquaporin Z
LLQILKLDRLSSNQKKFFAELIGAFVIVTLASGSVVLDAKYVGMFGLWFVALCPAVAVVLMVYAFRKISMAHFNPAVTLGYLITRHLPRNLIVLYLLAEAIGGFLASIFVRFIIGTQANLGANSPNYSYPIPLIFGIEVLATALLMTVILTVVHTKGLKGFSGVAIGGIIGLDIFFLSFISGASMNPIRSLAPAILSGYLNDLWLYLTATFVGSGIVAFIYRKRFTKSV